MDQFQYESGYLRLLEPGLQKVSYVILLFRQSVLLSEYSVPLCYEIHVGKRLFYSYFNFMLF
jgi:hypothetical protein